MKTWFFGLGALVISALACSLDPEKEDRTDRSKVEIGNFLVI